MCFATSSARATTLGVGTPSSPRAASSPTPAARDAAGALAERDAALGRAGVSPARPRAVDDHAVPIRAPLDREPLGLRRLVRVRRPRRTPPRWRPNLPHPRRSRRRIPHLLHVNPSTRGVTRNARVEPPAGSRLRPRRDVAASRFRGASSRRSQPEGDRPASPACGPRRAVPRRTFHSCGSLARHLRRRRRRLTRPPRASPSRSWAPLARVARCGGKPKRLRARRPMPSPAGDRGDGPAKGKRPGQIGGGACARRRRRPRLLGRRERHSRATIAPTDEPRRRHAARPKTGLARISRDVDAPTRTRRVRAVSSRQIGGDLTRRRTRGAANSVRDVRLRRGAQARAQRRRHRRRGSVHDVSACVPANNYWMRRAEIRQGWSAAGRLANQLLAALPDVAVAFRGRLDAAVAAATAVAIQRRSGRAAPRADEVPPGPTRARRTSASRAPFARAARTTLSRARCGHHGRGRARAHAR